MISLFLDTCNKNIVIGLLEDNKLIDKTVCINDNNLSEKLLPSIKELLDKNNIKVNNLNRIYVSVGPGSFTGIRIGLTVAKVMSWSLKIDIIPISSLEAFASTDSDYNYICPMIDARRGYVYASLYDKELNNIIKDQYIKREDFTNLLKDYKYEIVSYESDNKPILNIEKIVAKHVNDKSINPHKINPIYLKLTEAEEKRNDNRN